MHIIESYNAKAKKVYCYVGECLWDKYLKKYTTPRISIGHLEDNPPIFIPNNSFALLLLEDKKNQALTDDRNRIIIDTVRAKYGDSIYLMADKVAKPQAQTAVAVFNGPYIIFGGITSRYHLDRMLKKAFGDEDSQDILSLAWYVASEGGALSNSDAWLEQFETPKNEAISSQDISRLLDRMDEDGIMTFYKDWQKAIEKPGDKSLLDLTSSSYYGHNIDMVAWGHNKDNTGLPQVKFIFLCMRKGVMPLFAWPINGSVSDVKALENTLQFLDKLGYRPNCLMMDRGFSSIDNITYMLNHGYTFLQALKINANWIYDIIDAGRVARLRPDSMIKTDERTYYASTTICQWVIVRKSKKGDTSIDEHFVYQCTEAKGEKYTAQEGEEIISQHRCVVHVIFCQDLVGNQWDKFMEKLNLEYERLTSDEKAMPTSELEQYFIIKKEKWARKRDVDFNMTKIQDHKNNYAGHICFITNDKSIKTAKEALSEYSTRDYIEKDFDELKNDLDMRRIRVHSDGRMKARLFIQFVAEIYMREIRVKLSESKECQKMTRKQISSHIKGIYKIKFTGKYKDIRPELSKSQRSILEALDIKDSR